MVIMLAGAVCFLAGAVTCRLVMWRVLKTISAAPHLAPSGCTCTHAKSYHVNGSGVCQQLDETMKYVDPAQRGAHPPCKCQLYVPKDPPAPPAATPAAMARQLGYDPDYAAFLEKLTSEEVPGETTTA